MSFLLFSVYNKILYLGIFYHAFIKRIGAVSDIAVDKREVCQPVSDVPTSKKLSHVASTLLTDILLQTDIGMSSRCSGL